MKPNILIPLRWKTKRIVTFWRYQNDEDTIRGSFNVNHYLRVLDARKSR